MKEKIAMLESYINEADQVIESKNVELAKKFQNEVIAVYHEEIKGVTRGLDNYNRHWVNDEPVDYFGDVEILKKKLINYKNNLTSGLFKALGSGDGMAITVAQTATQTTSVAITLDQVIENIQQIPDDVLTEDEKDALSGKLAVISAEKDQKTKWDKIKGVLKWIGDKGVEVGIAALPYIAEALK